MAENRKVQYLSALAVSVTSMTNAASIFWATPTLPKFYNNEIVPNITNAEISWVVAMKAPGILLGSLGASRISDMFGRRTTLLSSALPFIIGTMFMLCVTKVWMLYIGRMLWGIGTGMTIQVMGIYISEIADKEIRGTLTALTRISFSLGGIILLTMGALVSYTILTCSLIVLPVCYFMSIWWVPESPYYLLKEGKVDAARKALLRLSPCKDAKVIEEKLTSMRSQVKQEMARSGSLKELFIGKRYRKAVIVTIGLKFAQTFTGTVAIVQYMGRIIQQSNCGLDVSIALIIFGVVRFVVAMVSPFVVDRVGRRPLLIYSFSAVSILLGIVGVYFFIQQVIGILDESTSPYRYVVYISILLYTVFVNMGYDFISIVMPAEIFPLNVKSIAMTLVSILTAVLSFVTLKGYQIVEDWTGLYGVFWCFAITALAGAVFSYFYAPETKGKSLKEIQMELQGDFYDDCTDKLSKIEVATDTVEDDNNMELKNMLSKGDS